MKPACRWPSAMSAKMAMAAEESSAKAEKM